MKLPCKKCGRVDANTLLEGDLCDACFWMTKYKELYRALQLLIGRANDTPRHEVSDQDVQSWIDAAKE